MTRLRPPCKLGSSFTLTRVPDAYRSWKAGGSGGKLAPVVRRGFLDGGDAYSASDSESESEYCTKDIN